jgi:hypothetical protein
MEQNNLAAAIVRCFGSQVVPGQLERSERLTNEEAISLADWLQRESSINLWRSIDLTQASSELEPAAVNGRISSTPQIK